MDQRIYVSGRQPTAILTANQVQKLVVNTLKTVDKNCLVEQMAQTPTSCHPHPAVHWRRRVDPGSNVMQVQNEKSHAVTCLSIPQCCYYEPYLREISYTPSELLKPPA